MAYIKNKELQWKTFIVNSVIIVCNTNYAYCVSFHHADHLSWCEVPRHPTHR